MEPTQTNPSPEISWIPQGIPTWVFAPTTQQPSVKTTPAVASDAEIPVAQQPVQQAAPVAKTEWPLDKFFKWLVRFIAKITGQPDPITGAPNPASKALQSWENIVGKVWGAANKAVATASNVATQAVDTATNVATQAAQQVQQIIPPPSAQQPAPQVQATQPSVQQPTPEQPK